MEDETDTLITKADVARMLHCTTHTVMNHVRRGDGFPVPIKLGKGQHARVLFKANEVRTWINDQQGGSV